MSASKTILATAALLISASAVAGSPEWLEVDSAAAIQRRHIADFPYTVEEAYQLALEKHPEMSRADFDSLIARKFVETDTFDGQVRVFRKAIRNMDLLNPEFNGEMYARGAKASKARVSYVDSVLDFHAGKNPLGGAHKVTYRFSIDVPYEASLHGDTLRVWMPVPHPSQRQSDITIISAYPAEYTLSDQAKTVHSTIYFETPVRYEQATHFEYTASFITRGEWFDPESIRTKIKLYNTNSDLYRQYTAEELPHMPRMTELARKIVGDTTDPLTCSELVYDYIISNYLWGGARDYSTIECIPYYVIDQGHGDCGQVALLYISLMRSLGIPARWESGWMLHPGEKNYHDWAEVYFEGVGWIPVDVSFGRYETADSRQARNFYSTGMDAHRFASNRGVCGQLDPAKRFVRSETVDLQPGEVEATSGNLYYPGWHQKLTLLSIEPIEQ